MEDHTKIIQTSDFFALPLNVYKFVGVRLFKTHIDEKKPLREKVAFLWVILELVPQFFCLNAYPVFGKFSSGLHMAEFISYEAFVANALTKIFSVWFGRFQFLKIMMKLHEIAPKTEKQGIEYRLEEHFAKIERVGKFVCIYDFTAGGIFTALALFKSVFQYFMHGEFPYLFPFILYYPIDEEQPHTYPLVYMYQACVSIILVCFIYGSDFLLLTTVLLLNMHFDHLANRIVAYVPNGNDKDLKELFYVIQRHDTLLSLSFEINDLFSISILMNYCTAGVMICMSTYQLLTGTDRWDLIKFFLMLTAALMHVWVVCVFGNDLIEKSENISDAIFSQKWYLGNAKYRKMIVLILARAQKPAFLTAFKFFIVSVQSFQSLLSNSYQVLTLLRSQTEA